MPKETVCVRQIFKLDEVLLNAIGTLRIERDKLLS